MSIRALTVFAGVVMATSAPAAEPACPGGAEPIPPALAGWSQPPARDPVSLASGMPARLTLRPAAAVRYAVAPEKPGAPGTYGATVTFDVPRAGAWQVGLGAGAWIDVIENGKAVASTAHGHGPACSGIRKLVAFPLKAGRHVLQLSGAPAASIKLIVAER